MSNRDCERCVHSRPYGGENNNRCTSWDCEFIDRKEAIKAYREKMAEKESKTEPQTDVATYKFVEWENGERTCEREGDDYCKDEPQKWTKENCKGCKYNEYPYDSGTCFVRVCIHGNKYEPKDEPQKGATDEA